MGRFEEFVNNNRVELVRRSTVLEGYMFTRLETQEILRKGLTSSKDTRRTREVININRAWSWLVNTKGYTNLLIEDLHEIISDEVTYKPKKRKSFEEMNLVQQIYLLTDIPFDVISAMESQRVVRGYSAEEEFSYY